MGHPPIRSMREKHKDILMRISVSDFPLVCAPSEKEKSFWWDLYSWGYLDCNEPRNREDYIIKGTTEKAYLYLNSSSPNEEIKEKNESRGSYEWWQKPIGITFLAVAAIIIGAIILGFLTIQFPSFFNMAGLNQSG